ncbi:MAG: hypothetical protein AAF720_00760 [Pseudomonadota bacterium]
MPYADAAIIPNERFDDAADDCHDDAIAQREEQEREEWLENEAPYFIGEVAAIVLKKIEDIDLVDDALTDFLTDIISDVIRAPEAYVQAHYEQSPHDTDAKIGRALGMAQEALARSEVA